MGDQDDGQLQFLVDLRQQLQHRGGGLRVEGAGGLVAEQDLRPAGQRAGDADALLLPAGKLRRVLARVLDEADAVEQLGDAGVDLAGAVVAGQAQRHGDVVGDGLRGQQVEVLEDHSDALAEAAQAVGVEGGDVFAVDDDAPAAGLFEAVDQAQQGALAGAGMADQAEHLAILDAQASRLQGRNIAAGDAIGLVDVVEFDHVANLVGAETATSCQETPGNERRRSAKTAHFTSVSYG
ncbi:hypothetical protein D9M71_333600 [compost metagenome]